MKDLLIVEGLGSADGEYEYDVRGLITLGHPEAMTNRESHLLKTLTGIRMGELDEALAAGDNDVLVAFAAIILKRAGKDFDIDMLWDSPAGSGIKWRFAEDQEEADGDSPPAGTGDEPAPEETEKSSGDDSTSDSESQENGQSRTGHPESAKSAISDLVILGN